MAGSYATANEMKSMVFPAKWEMGRRAGPIRNQQMIDECRPDLVIAFHENIIESKGTKDMVNRSMKAGIPTYLVSGGPETIRKLDQLI